MATTLASEPGGLGAMTPVPHRVVSRIQETADTWTLTLESLGEPITIGPGQFNMLYAFGVGEVPISTSAGPRLGGLLEHTIRDVGAVTAALCAAEPGDVIGVRGPFGTQWPLEQAAGGDLLIAAGGIGLAPLRPAVLQALASRAEYGDLCLLVGARSPAELLFRAQLEHWRGRFDFDVRVTVDTAVGKWHGRVGVVTRLIGHADFDPDSVTAMLCGPGAMMRFTARALLDAGVRPERIWISEERNMQCAVGLCGHCQLGPHLVCRDGPVFRYDEMAPLMEVREL